MTLSFINGIVYLDKLLFFVVCFRSFVLSFKRCCINRVCSVIIIKSEARTLLHVDELSLDQWMFASPPEQQQPVIVTREPASAHVLGGKSIGFKSLVPLKRVNLHFHRLCSEPSLMISVMRLRPLVSEPVPSVKICSSLWW